MSADKNVLLELRECVTEGIDWCISSHSGEAIDQLTELLSGGARVFTDQHYSLISELLRSPWGQTQLDNLKEESFSGDKFLGLVLAYTDVTIQVILANVMDPEKGEAARTIIGTANHILNALAANKARYHATAPHL